MKKYFALLLTVFMTASAIPNIAFGADKEVILSKRVAQKQNTELGQREAPVLTINSNTAYTQDFDFELLLNGAEWTDVYKDNTYDLGNGITYLTIGDSRLRIFVNATTYSPSTNDIEIPLFTKLTKKGEISVTVEPGSSSLERSAFVFAKTSGSEFSVESDTVPKLEMFGYLGDITIKDDFLSNVSENTVYPLTLDNDFIFTSTPTIETQGKYNNLVKFSIDKDDASKAYLTVTKTTDVGIGEITVSDLQVMSQKNSVFGPVNVILTRGNATLKIQVAEYATSSNTNIPISINQFVAEKAPKVSGTAARGRLLQIRIDDKKCFNITVGEDGTWSFTLPSEKKSLTVGKHTFSIGYYFEKTEKWVEVVQKEFFIPTKTEFTIGQNSYLYDDQSVFMGVAPYVDKNNRVMMPFRAFAAVLGTDKNGIIWNESDKTVTIKKDSTTLSVKIGSNELFINGVAQKMDTVAVIKSGRTFLPLRAVMNGFSLADDAILWDNDAQKVTLLLNH